MNNAWNIALRISANWNDIAAVAHCDKTLLKRVVAARLQKTLQMALYALLQQDNLSPQLSQRFRRIVQNAAIRVKASLQRLPQIIACIQCGCNTPQLLVIRTILSVDKTLYSIHDFKLSKTCPKLHAVNHSPLRRDLPQSLAQIFQQKRRKVKRTIPQGNHVYRQCAAFLNHCNVIQRAQLLQKCNAANALRFAANRLKKFIEL